ncbi:MAG: molybdenum cofactor guanylyltransferase [Myxococcales bacterium]|nr:molybdenum cofactor guanylyltransferase [Myxococcales bacterium]MDH5305642.1 molybdenum cofactor guanylyltransferase [Myxococcales bacterium]MDH5565127.1 molybdenum cofactor guanylyltransferase [Myxococcales bacterium]
MTAAGIVLCGGRSSRMGRDKAWLPWRDRPLVAHVVEILRQVVGEVIVVASKDHGLPPLAACVVRDRAPGLGPLAGIREGLAHLRGDLAFVCATDAPFITPRYVEAMLAFGCAAAPDVDGYVQTLSAVYPKAALEHAEALILAGRMRPLFLLEALHYRRVPARELPDLQSLRGFNTPDEYLKAVREEDEHAVATLEFLGRARLAMGCRTLEVPVGTLAEVLSRAHPTLELLEGERVARPFLVSIEARAFVRDASIPVGPGEHVIVMDASVGG